jgi:GTP cyclohydrolase I
VRKAGTRTTISALLGLLRDDAPTRQEFPSLVRE